MGLAQRPRSASEAGPAGLWRRARSSPRLLAAGGVGLAWGAASCWLGFALTARIRDWGVMTDELLYVRLATSAATRQSPLPVVRGASIGVINQLYPLLLAPLYGTLSAPSAFHVAHVLNAVLMASAVIPAYLLSRQVVGRRAALVVAALSVVTPWMVLAGFLMTEVVAYPAFLWAMLGIVRAVRTGGTSADLLALAGITLAILARVQFLLLGIVFVLAIFAHEAGFALAGARRASRRAALRRGLAAAASRHRVLGTLSALVLVAALLVAAFGSLSGVLGVYAPAARRGSLLPHGFWQAAAAHLDSVAVGCGLLPLVLGGGWMLTSLAVPRSRAAHAFATTALLALVALVLQTASFDLRFGGPDAVRDRYVFYVVPLLLAGTAALLVEARRPWLAPAAVTVLFASTVHWLAFPRVQGVWVDAPTRVLNDLLARQAGELSTQSFVAAAGALLGIAAIAGLRLLPPRAFGACVLALLVVFSIFASQRVIDHTIGSKSVSGRGMSDPPGIVLDWVDRVLPHGATAAILPYPTSPDFGRSAVLWWDVEFWNRSVAQAFVADDGDFDYTPFPSKTLAPDPLTGEIPGTEEAPPYLVAAKNESRFQLVFSHWIGTNFGLDILAVPRPYRVQWLTRGLQPDGWTRPNVRATIRVFAPSRATQLMHVSVTVAPPGHRAEYALEVGSRTIAARLPADAQRTETLDVCVPGDSFVDLGLTSRTSAGVPGIARSFAAPPPRRAGVLVTRVATQPAGKAC
jgi:hypothetical protein